MATGGRAEVVLGSATMVGLEEIIPNRRDNSLLIFGTIDGFNYCRGLVRALDIPGMLAPGAVNRASVAHSLTPCLTVQTLSCNALPVAWSTSAGAAPPAVLYNRDRCR